MSQNKSKAWPTLGFIKDSQDAALDGFLKLTKDLTIEVDGQAIDTKNLNMPKYLTAYDKSTKTEVIIGKLVKKRKTFNDADSDLQVFIALEPNVTFKLAGDKVNSSGFGSLESQGAQLARLDSLLADEKITEEQFETSKTNIGYSKAKVTLPPPRN